jgi:hypothetical protein
LDIAKLTALIHGQFLLEETVAKTPLPEITIMPLSDGLHCSIRYTELTTAAISNLSFTLN